MKQITEDYCSFEVSELLKEKGFNEDCHALYDVNTEQLDIKNAGDVFNNKQWENYISAPTQSFTLKWLREVHNIFIEINVSIDLNGTYHYAYSILDKECKYIKRFIGYYSSHELCVEEALLYVLKNMI
jgi:hypothetical protein